MLTPGAHVGRYEVLAPIGVRAPPRVWVARLLDGSPDRLFALRCVVPAGAADPARERAFVDEARIMASIEHPSVARVVDVGYAGPMLYVVTEYVEGASLDALLTSGRERGGSLVRVDVALRIAADACAGLHATHSIKDALGRTRGIVHGDLSPRSILVGVRGEVKVVDFGIARASGVGAGRLLDDATAGRHADVRALGATLFEMLAGSPPLDPGTGAAAQTLLSGTAPARLPGNVPPRVAQVVARALETDAARRFDSALAMQSALEATIEAEGYQTDLAAWVKYSLADTAVPDLAFIAPAPAPAPAHAHAHAHLPPPALALAPAHAPAPALAPALTPAPIGFAPAPASTPPASADDPAPGMLDVSALVARASSPDMSPASDQASHAPGASAPSPRRVRPRSRATNDAHARASHWTKVAVFATVLVFVATATLLLLPRIVRTRIVAYAREAGIELAIDRLGVGLDGITMRDVTARSSRVPGAVLHADEIFAAGASGSEIRVRGLDVKLVGHVRETGAQLLALYDENRVRIAGGRGASRRIAIVGASVAWRGALGEATSLDAGEVGLDLVARGAGADDLRLNVGRFDVKTKQTTLGPWASTLETSASSSRLRVLFDPPVPDGPSALLIWGPSTAPHLTVRVPRSPLARLGLRPAELGLPADPGTELAVKLDGGRSLSTRVEGTARADLFGARLEGLGAPVDVTIEASASGTPGKPLDLEKTTVTVGPFVAAVTGTITPSDLGLRLDAAWRTLPIACAKLARAEAKSMGPFATALQDIAHATGAARVTGTAQASGLVKYDTAAPGEASFTYGARESCGLSIFGN